MFDPEYRNSMFGGFNVKQVFI